MQTQTKLSKKDIIELFKKGCKPKSEHNIGIEYERLPIFSVTSKTADYGSEFGICNFLRNFAKEENWDYITDDYNIIGLKQVHDTVTLEPGCQIELSIKPEKTIDELKSKIDKLNKQMYPILNRFGISLLNYGVSPLSTHKSINLIPKRRYHIMAKYLWGILSDVMMRETAGVQCCIDFENEDDAMEKFRVANKLTPFMTAMFANSPIRGGVETGYKSFRALSWLNTDNDRCGFVGQIDEKFSFEEYVDYVLQTPMIFINRDNSAIPLDGKICFDEFMENGYKNFDADIEDLFKNYDYRDFSELRYNVPKNAMNTKIGNNYIKEIAKDILYIAEKSLIEMDTGEEKFLEPIKEYVDAGICPADVIIRNWNGIWNKDIKKLIKFVSEF